MSCAAAKEAEEAEADRLMLEELKADAANNCDDDKIEEDNVDAATGEDDDEYETIEPSYIRARSLFHTPEVIAAGEIELKWSEPDQAGN